MDQIALWGFAGLLGGVIGWLLRTYTSGYLQKKGENLATKEDIAVITHEIEGVRLQYSRQAAEIRAELRSLGYEREVKFARLHARRAAVIDGLYKRLCRTQVAFRALAGGIASSGDDDFQSRLEHAGAAARELLTFSDENRLYLPHDVLEAFDRVAGEFDAAWVTFAFERRDGNWPLLTAEERKEQVELWREARETVRRRVPTLRGILEGRMRASLGEEEAGQSVARVPDSDAP